MSKDIIVKLGIEATSEVHATLHFVNTSATDAYLYKPFVFEGRHVRNNLFTIEAEGQKLRYRGPIVKRRDPLPEDFLKLAPSGEYVVTVRLDDVYGFLAGEHSYEIYYSSWNPRPDHSSLLEITSNRESFRFRTPIATQEQHSPSSRR